MKNINIKNTMVNIYLPSEVTEEIALSPLDYILNSDEYILVSPYGTYALIEATINNNEISVIFDRDEYNFPYDNEGLRKIAKMSEIWYDTEDIDEIRNYLSYESVIDQAKKIFSNVEDITSPNDGCNSLKINEYYLFINTDGTFGTCHSDDFGFEYDLHYSLQEAFNTIK